MKNQPGLERSWGDREKDSRNQEQRRARNRKGKGGQEFGFHLNHSSENGLAKFSKDFFVAKSDSSFSVLNGPVSSFRLSPRTTPLVSPGWHLPLSLSACCPGFCSGLPALCHLHSFSLCPPHTPADCPQNQPPGTLISSRPSSKPRTLILEHLITQDIGPGCP